MNKKLLAQLLVIFVLTQAVGLFTGDALINAGISAPLITDNPEDVENSVGLFVYILVFTAALLVAIKFIKGNWLYYLLKLFESAAVLFAATIVFSAAYEGLGALPGVAAALPIPAADSMLVSFPLALLLVIGRVFMPKQVLLRNFSSLMAVAGAGAVIGVSLGVFPVIILTVLLAAYDFIAVFKTKHMVKLAKSVASKNLSFTYALPTKEHTFELGTGDLVIPLVFAVAVLKAMKAAYIFPAYLLPSLFILTASLIGLIFTIDYCSKNVGKALPALPLQTIFMLAAFFAAKLGGF